MNIRVTLSIVIYLGLLGSTISAATFTSQITPQKNPWTNPIALNHSTTLSLPANNLQEIKAIEAEILVIQTHLQEVQKKLGESFNGPGSKSPLTPRELRQLRILYEQMISNYTNIIGYFIMVPENRTRNRF